jgi:hypothetical protein
MAADLGQKRIKTQARLDEVEADWVAAAEAYEAALAVA